MGSVALIQASLLFLLACSPSPIRGDKADRKSKAKLYCQVTGECSSCNPEEANSAHCAATKFREELRCHSRPRHVENEVVLQLPLAEDVTKAPLQHTLRPHRLDNESAEVLVLRGCPAPASSGGSSSSSSSSSKPVASAAAAGSAATAEQRPAAGGQSTAAAAAAAAAATRAKSTTAAALKGGPEAAQGTAASSSTSSGSKVATSTAKPSFQGPVGGGGDVTATGPLTLSSSGGSSSVAESERKRMAQESGLTDAHDMAQQGVATHMSLFNFELIMLSLLGISLPTVYWRKIRIRHL